MLIRGHTYLPFTLPSSVAEEAALLSQEWKVFYAARHRMLR